MKASEIITQACCRLLTQEPFYGTFCIMMKWIPSEMQGMPEEAKTLGVRVVNKGVECVYYPPFIERYSVDDMMFFIQHEIEHIVRLHCVRRGDRHHHIFNIAADMTLHGRKTSPKITVPTIHGKKYVPDIDKWIWVPDDWSVDETADHYYEKLMENAVCAKCGKSLNGPGDGGSSDQEKDEGDGDSDDTEGSCSGKCQCHGQTADNHEIWEQSTESENEARQIIKRLVDDTLEKTQGTAPGHLQDAIDALSTPIVHWNQILRHYQGRYVGSKRPTWSRRNRRIRKLGFKGVSHHAASRVNVIIDTSGSISQKELQQFFAEIESILTNAKVTCIQWDTDLQAVNKYRRGDWKKIEIKGRGGTMMDRAVNWIVENNMVADLQIMLTDGYTEWPKEYAFPMVWVITEKVDGPDWGHKIYIDG